MSTTVKRITISLTKEQERQLKALCDFSGENQSQLIHRALAFYYQIALSAMKKAKEEELDNPPQS